MVKNLPDSAADLGSVPGSGRSPAEGNGDPLQYSCQGNLMDRGAWWATVHGLMKELDPTERLDNRADSCQRVMRAICDEQVGTVM